MIIACVCCNTHSNIETVKLLIDRGADIDAENTMDETALICALRYGTGDMIDVVKLLINCNVNHQDNNLNTALNYAPGKDVKIATLLISSGSDLNAKNNQGRTILMNEIYYMGHNNKIMKMQLMSVIRGGADFLSHLVSDCECGLFSGCFRWLQVDSDYMST